MNCQQSFRSQAQHLLKIGLGQLIIIILANYNRLVLPMLQTRFQENNIFTLHTLPSKMLPRLTICFLGIRTRLLIKFFSHLGL